MTDFSLFLFSRYLLGFEASNLVMSNGEIR